MKIDLHIHTIKNEFLDRAFSFDKEALKEYVISNSLDIIAITNHNLFDKSNFDLIKNELKNTDCLALPGIEISLETGHILLVFDDSVENITTLMSISSFIKMYESDDHYKMSVLDFNNYCCNKGAIIIPHYDKTPKITKPVINQIIDNIYAGEVDSPKKFYKLKSTDGELTPVYFSDIRIGEAKELEDYRNKSRFTYIDCNEKSFNSLKSSLKRNSTYISKNKIPEEFDVLNGTASASTGINVLIGKRSSGKTYTLNHISEEKAKNCLYIKQFEITKDCNDDTFKTIVEQSEKRIVLDYVSGINSAFDILEKAKVTSNTNDFNSFISTLKESADEQIADIYSKCPLYNSSELVKKNTVDNEKLTKAVENLLDANEQYKQLIEKHIERDSLIKLYLELIKERKSAFAYNNAVDATNRICKQISNSLGQKSSVKQIKRCDILSFFESLYVKKKFDELIKSTNNIVIDEDSVLNKFKKKTLLYKQSDKRTWKSLLKLNQNNNIDYLSSSSPSDAYIKYMSDSSLTYKVAGDDRYLIFFRSETNVFNENGKSISGGQRAEYILLRKLSDYKMYDLILIDEMESSFDNPFLNTEVVRKIKMIGQTATVFISTHNNNLGVSLEPNYYIYHEVINNDGDVVFKHYCGKANDDYLICPTDGGQKKLSKVLVDTMEANENAYTERKDKYDIA